MLSDQQIAFYRTFGFLVLRQHLDPAVVRSLSDEVDRALQDAFGPRLADRSNPGGGIAGHYLPVMGPLTPVSLALVEDERLAGLAEELLGGPVLPSYAEAILYHGQTGLHCDHGTDVIGAKVACYLEPLVATNGALRLLAGSHHPGYLEALRGWRRRHVPNNDAELRQQVEGLPGVVAETRPGDVIVFGTHTWHASTRGAERRQWTVTYFADPRTEAETTIFRAYVAGEADWLASGGYGAAGAADRARYPFYDPDWSSRPGASPRRERWIARLRELGYFDALGVSSG